MNLKRLTPVCFLLCACASHLRSGPTEDAIVAVMKLSDQPSYSWVSTVQDDARTYDIEGRTMRGGFTRVRMPVINTVRRKLGRSVTDTQIEVIFRGNTDCVLETEDGWRMPQELPDFEPPGDFERRIATGMLGVSGGTTLGGGSMRGSVLRAPSRRVNDPEERHYSNLQLAISHPHEELGVIVGSHTEFVVEGDVVTGTFTELGAALLLVRDGQQQITPLRAAGTFKLWLRDGAVTRYQVKLHGTLRVDTPRGRRTVEVQQTAFTTLKDVARTSFDVPEQARRKLGS
jgi:hypothetical protein